MGFDGLVDVVVTSGGFGVKKPDLAIFRACLERLEVRADQAAFVGDDLAADIEPAQKLGMLTIWKSHARSDRAAFCHPELQAIQAYVQSASEAEGASPPGLVPQPAYLGESGDSKRSAPNADDP